MGSGPPEPTPEGQGRLVGRRYRLLSPVGRGGMGMVWHAHDVLLDRDVAVKELILPFGLDHAGKQVAHRRMLREARSAARLSHPGIVTVHDVVEEDGRPWIVMELVRAWSLEQAVRQSGPLPVVQTAEIGIRVLDALRHAHAAGILHRDVKPGNVLLTADRVVLTDFGIAAIEGDVTITQTGLLMGSPAYIPPERLRGRPTTHAADLWSFGATLYAAVEGRPPYEGSDAVAVLGAVLTQEPNRPQRAGALLPVIEGLLRKNPADRIAAAQAAEMLEGVLRSHSTGSVGRAPGPQVSAPVPTPQNPTPMQLLPPFDLPSGPLPSRIIETPSGPVRVPYDPLASPTGGYAMPQPQLPPWSVDQTSGVHRVDGPGSWLESDARARGGSDIARDWPGSGTAWPLSAPAQDLSGPQAPPDPFAAPQNLPEPERNIPPDPFTVGPQSLLAPHTALDPFSAFGSPSSSNHAPGRPSGDAMWPAPAPADLPGQLATNLARELADDLSGPFASGAGRSPAHTGGIRSRDGAAGPQETGAHSKGRVGPTTKGRPGGRRRAAPAEAPAKRHGRLTILVVAVAVVVVSVVTVILVATLSGDSDDQNTGAQPPAAAAPAPAPAPVAASREPLGTSADVPKNFKSETAGGITAAVPKTWTVATQNDIVTFSGPKDSGQKITVAKIADGSLAALQVAEQKLNVEEHPDYIQVQLDRSAYRWPAADWEYTYTNASEVTVHTVTRYVRTDAQAYSITFTSPDYDWNESAANTRQILWSTFTPA